MSTRVHPLDFPAVQNLILDIQALESRAHRLKMVKAAHALNEAMNKTGWELAEQVEETQRPPTGKSDRE